MKFKVALAQIAVFLTFGTGRMVGQTITGFSPTLGSPNDTVTITGVGFAAPQGGNITFWQNKAVPFQHTNSDTMMTVHVPSGATTGPITITRGAYSQSSQADFTVVGAGPYITDVSPSLGAVGDSVTINGVHFIGATSVKFNGTAAPGFTGDAGGTQIFVNVPAGATSGTVTVTGPSGTGTSPSSFTVIGPGPYISGFSPAVGPSNSTVTISGRHFTGLTGVKFNGTNAASASATTDTEITAVTPMTVTTGPIKVTTSIGNYTSPTNFFVPPTVSSFSPGAGQPTTTVTITGKNFTGATGVKINGAAASYSVINNTSISATVPTGVNSGLVRVITPAGSAFSSSNFKIQPTISSFSPGFGSAGATVTISGANLNEGLSSVKFNGVPASFSPPAFGSVAVTVPSATTGPISLTTSNGTVFSASDFSFPASITSFTPGTGSAGTPVNITGQNFLDASSVTFGGAIAGFFVNGNTSISATAPAGVPSGTVKVTTPAGTATSAALFYAPPAITSFAPTHGLVGAMVTITGTNFLGASAVQFNGLNASSFTVVNNGSIQVAVPSGAQNGPITVVAPASSYATTTNFILDYRSDLVVTITDAPDPVTVGSNLVYIVSVLNNGPDSAPNVMLTNYLPASVTLKSAMASQGTLATNDYRTLVASFGSLGFAGVVSMTLTVAPTNIGTIFDSANAVSGYPDPVASNSVASASTIVQPLPLLSISRATGNQVRVSWALGLSNYSLQYKSDLPTNFSWVSNSSVPVLSNNLNNVTEPATNARRFYRLIR
jgi:uncharacterized repeat protein (TIGR01451 family)